MLIHTEMGGRTAGTKVTYTVDPVRSKREAAAILGVTLPRAGLSERGRYVVMQGDDIAREDSHSEERKKEESFERGDEE